VFRLIRKLPLIILVIVVITILARNALGRWIAKSALEKWTGFPVAIDQFSIKLNQPLVIVRDITLHNPQSFYQEPRAIKINLIEAYYDLNSLSHKELHLRQLVLDIAEIVAVKNKNGELNLKQFQHPTSYNNSSSFKPIKKFKIDEVVLSIGEILYFNERYNNPELKTYKINIKNRRYQNINTPEDIKKLIMNLTIQSLPNNLLDLTTQTLGKSIQEEMDVLKKGKDFFKFFEGSKVAP